MTILHERYAIAFVVLLLVVQFGIFPALLPKHPHEEVFSAEAPAAVTRPLHNPFADLVLDAAAVHVLDLRTGKILYQKNSRAELPLASLTKLMTALIATEHLDDTKVITITPQALEASGDTGLYAGEQFRLADLVNLTLVSSSNDGAEALAAALAGVLSRGTSAAEDITSLMNRRAEELGLSTTHFINPTGLDVGDALVGGAYGSAQDISKLLKHIVYNEPELLESTQKPDLAVTSLAGFSHTVQNTNEIVDAIPWLIGSKTGFTDLAGGNLAVVFDAGLAHPVAAVVLGATKESRFTDIQKLVETTFEYFQLTNTPRPTADGETAE